MTEYRQKLFLSTAEEDSQVAGLTASRLSELGYEVFYWQDHRGGRFPEQIEEAMNGADAFVALLSPAFVASNWCRREVHLAILREEDQRRTDPRATFIHVMEIQETSDPAAGLLRIYDRVSVTGSADLTAAIADLSRQLQLGEHALSGTTVLMRPEAPPPDFRAGETSSPAFRNRTDELEKVINGLTGAGGPHFWLVIAAPQLGKTWFLAKMLAELEDAAGSPSSGWSVGRVDVRDQPPEVRGNVTALLALLFNRPWLVTTDQDSLLRIAQEICTSRKSWLCLLDRAEMLDVGTALALRSCISQIYDLVRRNGPAGVRVGLVVASRREDKWRSVAPPPRLSTLVLTEFSVEIVEDALRDLAAEMGRTIGADTYAQTATLVHQLGQGLPALLSHCLQWIRTQEWMELERRLPTQELFEELAQPYIQTGLLSPDSLFSWNGGRRPHQGECPAPARLALEHAFRILAPYRIFTQSHLRHYLDTDQSFADALRDAEWSIEDLWQAISGTALLRRPLDEPWQELHAAIRRLLYRYYFKSDTQRAAAHREASEFVRVWSDRQPGKEQVIGLVEALWHEAVALSLDEHARMEESLTESARKLSHALADSSAYSVSELRAYAADRMRNDEELQASLSPVNGLFDRLVAIIETAADS